jgi:coenzyme F420 hydrogenase subunit beta
MKNYTDLIGEVIEKDLCCYCGTCEGICPENAIETSYYNIKETGHCTNCQICYKSCPGIGFDYKHFNEKIFKSPYPTDTDLGYYQQIYAGYSRNRNIRDKASSGGIVTGLLIGLLSEGKINGAIVVKGRNGNDFDSEVTIAKKSLDISEACQSKYITVYTNKILTQLRNIRGKYAYVGLPCQIHGLRKAEKENPWLKSKIALYIGLFCGFNLYPDATSFLLNKLGIDQSQINGLKYRGGADETGFFVECTGGKEYFIKKHAYTFLNMSFSPKRCWKCYDLTAEFADISVGDAWEKNNGGWSRIITRNEKSDDIIKEMTRKRHIHIEESNKSDIAGSQSHLIRYKKRWFWTRYRLFANNPDYNIEKIPKLSIKEKITGTLFFLMQALTSTLFLKKIINLVPLRILSGSSEFFRDLLSRSGSNR